MTTNENNRASIYQLPVEKDVAEGPAPLKEITYLSVKVGGAVKIKGENQMLLFIILFVGFLFGLVFDDIIHYINNKLYK